MQEVSSSPSEGLGLSSLSGLKCRALGFVLLFFWGWIGVVMQLQLGLEFFRVRTIPGVAGDSTRLGGISSPLHSVSGWSSLPAPQHSWILSLDLDCSVFYLHFWLDC